jgi:hypothetical protein
VIRNTVKLISDEQCKPSGNLQCVFLEAPPAESHARHPPRSSVCRGKHDPHDVLLQEGQFHQRPT